MMNTATVRNDYEMMFDMAMGIQNAGRHPYPYQRRLAADIAFPELMIVPTGLGKTAATILAWLWRRRFAEANVRESTPRRLIYCLPMRSLVEQTRDEVILWLYRLGLLGGCADVQKNDQGKDIVVKYLPDPGDQNIVEGYSNRNDSIKDRISVVTLMGGEDEPRWDDYPERDVIIIGTQDMLLSRALNRGYGLSRYRWPMQFGLLNNDCLWVVDEVQLMGPGLLTTAQLHAFRDLLGTYGNNKTLWMSATAKMDWLTTVDFHPRSMISKVLELSKEDQEDPIVGKRLRCNKGLERVEIEHKNIAALADLVSREHVSGNLTLVIVNTVKRAKELHKALINNTKDELILLHSQFRQDDRRSHLDRLLSRANGKGMICISTQVVEAGMDISAKVLISDLAPWSSMAQRFGRCNRSGEFDSSKIFWIDSTGDDKEYFLPYEKNDVERSREILLSLTGKNVSPDQLPSVNSIDTVHETLRKKDLIDLFDTTSDLAGNDIDISRFIRDVDERTVWVFWRDLKSSWPLANDDGPVVKELCAVPIDEIKKFLTSEKPGYRYDSLEGEWVRVDGGQVRPTMTLMLGSAYGGYSSDRGWDPSQKAVVKDIRQQTTSTNDKNYDHNGTSESKWSSLASHSDQVVERMDGILKKVIVPEAVKCTLTHAARWHDAGKCHPIFQSRIILDKAPKTDKRTIWGKAPRDAWVNASVPFPRKRFRHELASALMAMKAGEDDLVAYLVAAHHGKVRLSIRSMPGENKPDDPTRRFARGVWEGDKLPATDLGGGVDSPEMEIDLSIMELGESHEGIPSWSSRMLALRDNNELGPFRLALLECLMKAADERASGGLP
jgi:CRISPR-associated endonuclease/helicase Cas3